MKDACERTDRLRLLGGFELVVDGGPISLGQSRLEELVAFIAVHPGETFSRSQIAYRFWPDSTEKQSRTNTRHLLFKLKQAWSGIERIVCIDRSSVTWRMDAPGIVDVHLMRDLMEQADAAEDPMAKSSLLKQAAECYQGDFLPDCFNDWALGVREQVNTQYSTLLAKLVDVLVELREYDGALIRARQLIDHDSVQEVAYRRLMQVHVARGDRAAALRVYHTCASMLQKELGVEPSPATMQMRATLLQITEYEPPPHETPRAVERPRLIGRHREWQQLKQVWSAVQQGTAHSVFIWGEAGIGKTRLAEELLDWVRHQGHVAISSRSYAAEGALNYAPITEWLRNPTIRSITDSVDNLWQVELARLLPELLVENSELPEPGPLTEAWQQQRFYQSIVRVFQKVSGPLLLHLDDMQWGDQETLMLLHFLLHNARSQPLLLLGTIRSEDAIGNSSLTTLAEAFRHSNQLSEFVLTALSGEETAQLAELTAGTPLSSERNTALYEASEGHPLYLIESVRSEMATEQAPTRHATPQTSPIQLQEESGIPTRIFQLLSSRLLQLSPEAQLVASVASVIGHSFTYAILKESTDIEEALLVDTLDELWTRRIIREQEGDSYDFSHDRIREVAYQQISRTRRRLLHRKVAEALENENAEDIDEVAGELAHHYAHAGDSYRAYQYYREAANLALRQYALARADELFTASLDQLSNDAVERIMTLNERSGIFALSLDFERWKLHIDEQLELLNSIDNPPSSLVMEVHISMSQYYVEQNAGHKAQEAAQIAVTEAENLGVDIAMARAYQAMARGCWMQASMAEASHFYGLSTEFARRAGDRDVELISLELHAATGMFSGMSPDEILDRITHAYALAEAVDNKRHIASLRNKLGYLAMAQGTGEFDMAEREYRIGIALTREIGDRAWEEIILCNLGMMFVRKGDYRQAIDVLTEALRIGQVTTGYWRSLVTSYHLGSYWMEMGCLDQAQLELTAASEGLHQRGNYHFEAKARCDLGLVHYLAGEYERARRELSDVLELVEGHGDLRFEALVRTRLGYVYEETGELAEACESYRRGYELHSQMQQNYYALNALAGSARVASRRGNSKVTQDHVETIWRSIQGKSIDASVETAMTLRTCYCVFTEQNDARQDKVLSMARAQLRNRSDNIDTVEHQEHFWQLAPHSFFRDGVTQASLGDS